MADVLNVDVAWAGQQANEVLIIPTFNTPELTTEFRIILDIKSKRQLALDTILSGVVRPSEGCGRDVAGDVIDVYAKEIVLCDLKVNLNQCAKNLANTFMEEWLRTGNAITDLVGTDVEAYILDKVTNALRLDVYDIAWFGDVNSTNDTLASCNGIWSRLIQGANAYDIEKVTIPTTLGDCTALDTLRSLYEGASDLLDQMPEGDKYFALTRELYNNYLTCREDACCGDKSWDMVEMGPRTLMFRGIPVYKKSRWSQIISANNMLHTHRAVYTYNQNLVIGTDAISDTNTLDFYYVKQDKMNYIDAEFKMGTQYVYGELTAIALS
jgi:hypothetical protein